MYSPSGQYDSLLEPHPDTASDQHGMDQLPSTRQPVCLKFCSMGVVTSKVNHSSHDLMRFDVGCYKEMDGWVCDGD
jgi:hypothetical protein